MAIPDFQTLMLPLLRDVSTRERTGQETLDALAKEFSLTAEELAQRLPSGNQTTFTNRVAWAKAHLKGAGLIESPRRAVYRITDRGRAVLAEAPSRLDINYLMSRFPEYVAYRRGGRDDGSGEMAEARPAVPAADDRTPDDLIEDGYQQYRAALLAELRERIARMSSQAFEQLVIDLLTKLVYGDSRENAGRVTGQSGDQGIDGVIHLDRLGLQAIYVQAKRWQDPVGSREIREFAGALQGQKGGTGVFITASNFTKDARDCAKSMPARMVLIDGGQLADLMIDHGVGVTTVKRYEIKRVDSDYFTVE